MLDAAGRGEVDVLSLDGSIMLEIMPDPAGVRDSLAQVLDPLTGAGPRRDLPRP